MDIKVTHDKCRGEKLTEGRGVGVGEPNLTDPNEEWGKGGEEIFEEWKFWV